MANPEEFSEQEIHYVGLTPEHDEFGGEEIQDNEKWLAKIDRIVPLPVKVGVVAVSGLIAYAAISKFGGIGPS